MGRRARESRTGYRYWVKWNYEPAVPYRFSPPSVASSKKENSLLFIIQYIKLLPKNLEDTCKIEIMNIFLFINYNLAYMFMPNYSNKYYYQLKWVKIMMSLGGKWGDWCKENSKVLYHKLKLIKIVSLTIQCFLTTRIKHYGKRKTGEWPEKYTFATIAFTTYRTTHYEEYNKEFAQKPNNSSKSRSISFLTLGQAPARIVSRHWYDDDVWVIIHHHFSGICILIYISSTAIL